MKVSPTVLLLLLHVLIVAGVATAGAGATTAGATGGVCLAINDSTLARSPYQARFVCYGCGEVVPFPLKPEERTGRLHAFVD